jgi:tRNA U34 5-carboxymethylaminomethyl modifying GTPase MnmE/TrmE
LVGEVAGEEGDGWGCLRCGRVIKHVKRWMEVVVEESAVIEEDVDIPEESVEVEQETSLSEEIETSENDVGEVEVESSDEDNLFG